MKPILLRNPTGGHKHAYMPAELEADLERGWVRVDDEKPVAALLKAPEKIDRRKREHRNANR